MIVALTAYTLFEGDLIRLNSIEITLDPLSEERALFRSIEADLNSKLLNFLQQPLFKVSIQQILHEVVQDERVHSAQVRRVFPAQMEVRVTPHQPTLVYMSEQGDLWPVARDASLLPTSSLADTPDVPILRGRLFSGPEGQALRLRAVEILDSLPDRGSFSRWQISEIHYEERTGFELTLLNGVAVFLGQDGLGQKASQIEQVLDYLQQQQISGRVIDARFSKKVVVKLRHQL